MNSGPMLSIGSTGPDVRRLQVLFVMMKEMNFSDVDGKFLPKTLELVKSFQEGSNLTADGLVGPFMTQLCGPQHPEACVGSNGQCCWASKRSLKKFDVPNSHPGNHGSFGPRTGCRAACLSNPAGLDGGRRCWRSDAGNCIFGWRRSNTCFSIRLGNCSVADELAQSWSRPPCPGFIEPCLPTNAQAVPAGPQWAYEIKHDGYRFARRELDRVRNLTARE